MPQRCLVSAQSIKREIGQVGQSPHWTNIGQGYISDLESGLGEKEKQQREEQPQF
jgi:hypothetical protein